MRKKDFTFSKSRKIDMFDLQGNFIKTFNKMTEASFESDCDISSICSCCRGDRKRVNNYVFKYNNDNLKIKENTLDIFAINEDLDILHDYYYNEIKF
jgi:hypothetical protein